MSNNMFKKIQFKKKTTAVADMILELINTKQLSVGDKLPSERYLAESMGVSRGALRESLRALDMVGIIETKVGDGSYIKSTKINSSISEVENMIESGENPLNVIKVRKRIEPLSASLAAQNANEENIKPLEKILDEHKSLIGEQDIDYEIDGRFHVAIAEMTENATLIDVMRVIINRMAVDRFWRYGKEKSIGEYKELEYFIQEHQNLFDAIKNNDSKTAEKLALKHLTDVEKGLKRYF